MKTILSYLALILVLATIASTASYIGGRIVLPEVGLTAPTYLTWWWAAFWSSAIYVPVQGALAWIKDA